MSTSDFDLSLKIHGQGHKQSQNSLVQGTNWVRHPINSHPFHSLSNSSSIPEIQLLQNLTLKIHGQGHGWGSHFFRFMSTSHPIPEKWLFQYLTLNIPGQGHGWVPGGPNIPSTHNLTSLLFHVNQPCHSWDTTTGISNFHLENPRSRS